jgi:hypothetical protein
MIKRRIKRLNNKYIVSCHIKINKGTKVFYVPLGCVRVPPVQYHWCILSWLRLLDAGFSTRWPRFIPR